jgi:hypothetical protein
LDSHTGSWSFNQDSDRNWLLLISRLLQQRRANRMAEIAPWFACSVMKDAWLTLRYCLGETLKIPPIKWKEVSRIMNLLLLL